MNSKIHFYYTFFADVCQVLLTLKGTQNNKINSTNLCNPTTYGKHLSPIGAFFQYIGKTLRIYAGSSCFFAITNHVVPWLPSVSRLSAQRKTVKPHFFSNAQMASGS